MNKRALVFIPTWHHWLKFKEVYPDSSEINVLTYDFSVGALLQEQNQNCYFMTDFLSLEELEHNFDRATNLITQWPTFLGEPIYHKGIDLFDNTVHELWHVFFAAFNIMTIFPKLVSQIPLKSLILFNDMKQPQYLDMYHVPSPDPLNAIMLWIAYEQGIPVIRLKPHPVSLGAVAKILNENLKHFSEYGIQDLSNLSAKKTLQKMVQKRHPFKRVVMSLGYSLGLNDRRMLNQHLINDPETLLVYVLAQNTPAFLESDSSICVDFRPYKLWPFDLSETYRQIDQRWQILREGRSTYQGEWPALFANAFLDFQFNFYFTLLKDAVRTIEATRLLLDTFRPQVFITGGVCVIGAIRCSVRTCQQWGIPTVNFLHGGLWTGPFNKQVHRPICDYVATRGMAAAELFRKAFDFPQERLIVTGDLRVGLPIVQPKPTHQTDPQLQKLKDFIGNRPTVLLLSGAMTSAIYTIGCDLSAFLKRRLKMFEMIERRKDIAFVLKPHPGYDDYQFYQSYCQQARNVLLLDPLLLLGQVLPLAQAAILLAPSSSALEAAMAQVPVIYSRESVYRTPKTLGSSLDDDGALCVDTLEELEQALDSVLFDPIVHQEVIAAGQRLLAAEVDCTGDIAVEHSVQLIDRLVEQTAHIQYPEEYDVLGEHITDLARQLYDWSNTGSADNFQAAIQELAPMTNIPQKRDAIQAYLERLKQCQSISKMAGLLFADATYFALESLESLSVLATT